MKVLLVFVGLLALSFAAYTNKYGKKYVRPCLLHDLKCIGDNLGANSNCNKNVRGYVEKEYTVPEFRFEAPYFNATYIDHDMVVKNHHLCRVSEFFFNTEADSGVLAVDCPGLTFQSNRTINQHYSLREDKIYSFSSHWKYPLIRMTTNFRRADSLNLCTSYVFTDVAVLPTFVVTPNDKPTASFLSKDLSYMPIYERERGSFIGPYLLHYYINNLACDFGCS